MHFSSYSNIFFKLLVNVFLSSNPCRFLTFLLIHCETFKTSSLSATLFIFSLVAVMFPKFSQNQPAESTASSILLPTK